MTGACTRGVLSLLLLAGCTLSNLSPQARFTESAYRLNDAARWGQVDVAAEEVSPNYRPRFLERRKYWGERVQIAEVETVYLHITPDKEGAVSEISLSWTDAAGVMLRKSFVTQRWASKRGNFKLVDEAVKKGDPGVFAE